MYGKTRVLEDDMTSLEDCVRRCSEGRVVPKPIKMKTQQGSDRCWTYLEPPRSYSPYSRRFQWLPAEVQIKKDEEGRIKSEFTSYINNLHPAGFPKLYQLIEEIISYSIPLWNRSLTPLRYDWEDIRLPRMRYHMVEYDGDPEDEFNRVLIVPDAPEWRGAQPHPEDQVVDLVKDYGDKGLQVIVKLANIHLAPEKPGYEGGTWHVEGQLVSLSFPDVDATNMSVSQNEHICATSLYYYDSENVTPSRLTFRQQSQSDYFSDVFYHQDDHDWLSNFYGLENWEASIQEVGAVETREGRLLTFPNDLQHQVQPFKLADPTKPGHRKILALFLVDPNVRIISTANVPCQRRDWWAEEVRHYNIGVGTKDGRRTMLPPELQA